MLRPESFESLQRARLKNMPNQIYALALIFLSAMPGFGAKINLQNQLTQKITGNSSGQNELIQQDNTPTLPFKTDPLSQSQVVAKSAYFVDFNSGEVLYAKNENQK